MFYTLYFSVILSIFYTINEFKEVFSPSKKEKERVVTQNVKHENTSLANMPVAKGCLKDLGSTVFMYGCRVLIGHAVA
jgi:hypothetical protein